MATCEDVALYLQAWADDELSEDGKRVLDAHLLECSSCREERFAIRSTVSLARKFYEPHRLSPDFVLKVVAKLPSVSLDRHVAETQSVRKKSGIRRSQVRWWVPLAASAVLAIYFGVLATYVQFFRTDEPGRKHLAATAGKVAGLEGRSTMSQKQGTEWKVVPLRDTVYGGSQLSTEDNSKLGFILPEKNKESSSVKMNEATTLEVEDSRLLKLVRGEIWVKVTKGDRAFQVNTPNGNVIVTGTEFTVKATAHETTVAVVEGNVVLTDDSGAPTRFVNQGVQGKVVRGQKNMAQEQIDPETHAGWAKKFKMDVKPTETLLAYDDGLVDGQESLPGSVSHAVKFTPAQKGGTVEKVLVYAGLYGDSKLQADRWVRIDICSERMEPIGTSVIRPYTYFDQSGGWVTFDVPSTKVQSPFYVLLTTDSNLDAGVAVGYDSSSPNRSSRLGSLNGPLDWNIAEDQNKVNWMVRVIGDFTQ